MFKGRCGIYQTDEGFTNIFPMSNFAVNTLAEMSVSPLPQILIGEVTSFFVKTERAQEKTIVTADCCYFNPLLRRIVRFLGQLNSEGLEVI